MILLRLNRQLNYVNHLEVNPKSVKIHILSEELKLLNEHCDKEVNKKDSDCEEVTSIHTLV